MSRKRFSEREVIETLWHQGVTVPCYRCKNPIRPGEKLNREHLDELALGGQDAPGNCAYSHKLCHDVVTNGTKATTAGSSKHKIAKSKRIAKGKMEVKKPTLRDEAEANVIAVRGSWDVPMFEACVKAEIADIKRKRTLKSRGFQEKPEGYQYRWGK